MRKEGFCEAKAESSRFRQVYEKPNPLGPDINVGTKKDSMESFYGVLFYLAPFFRKTALIVSKTHLMSNIKLQ